MMNPAPPGQRLKKAAKKYKNSPAGNELFNGSAKLPPSYVSLPTTLLRSLAVDKNHHGKGLGERLLLDALRRAYENSVTSIIRSSGTQQRTNK
jgi:GNAT superfamily N-acetyltransferase